MDPELQTRILSKLIKEHNLLITFHTEIKKHYTECLNNVASQLLMQHKPAQKDVTHVTTGTESLNFRIK